MARILIEIIKWYVRRWQHHQTQNELEDDITSGMAREILEEIDREILNDLINKARK